MKQACLFLLMTCMAIVFAGRAGPQPGLAQGPTTIDLREKWTGLFANRDVDLHLTVKGAADLPGKLVWNLSALNQRTLSSGEQQLAAGDGKPASATIRLRLPEVKDGVVLQTRLKVFVLGAKEPKPLAAFEKLVWVFPENPFRDRKAWLEGLHIQLFDPQKTTADTLRKAGVPFDEVGNLAILDAVDRGLLIVGQGITFADEYADLAERVNKLAARGIPVLVLAPAGGSLKLPEPEGVASMSWRRQDVIAGFDKALDRLHWPPDNRVLKSSLILKTENQSLYAEVCDHVQGWPWIEARFLKKNNKLVVCSFDLFGNTWEAGPTPRYLFIRLLEHLAEKREAAAKD